MSNPTDQDKINRLNTEVTSAIYLAEDLETKAIEAWRKVADLEKQLSEALPEGQDRNIAIRGVRHANRNADMIETRGAKYGNTEKIGENSFRVKVK